MRGHNMEKIPAGFRPVSWDKVGVNEVVYLQAGDGRAMGPHQVVDPQLFTLRNLASYDTHTCDDQILMYRDGPRIVTTWTNGAFAGIYADIPLEVAAASINDNADQLYVVANTRSRPLDALPDDYKRVLDRTLDDGWLGMYGKWEVTASAAKEPEELTVSFMLSDLLAANALMVELTNGKKAFTVRPSAVDQRVEFEVTQVVYDWITLHLSDHNPTGLQ